ncbi:unnamed protein product, partial [Nippostrongylus brasiliensis]|uniref:Phlebovirus_G2 domain-containing protein n=1 Tax=Nippostrongylus brasiliensis TaxID=27835 RepID=A0A0N4YXA8_NIPBR
MNCTLHDNCRCSAAEIKVHCECTHDDIASSFSKLNLKLPLKTPAWEMKKRGEDIIAKIPHLVSADFMIEFNTTFTAITRAETDDRKSYVDKRRKESVDEVEKRYLERTHSYDDILHEVTERFVDSHCHLDFIQKQGCRTNWNSRESAYWHRHFAGCIPNFVDPNLYSERSGTSDLEWILTQVQSPFTLGATYGCHPHYGGRHRHEIYDLLLPMLHNQGKFRCVAIGECGLDYLKNDVDPATQKEVFLLQLRLAKAYDLPVVIHCRSGPKGDAEADCLKIMEEADLPRSHNIHRHCFTETWEVAKDWFTRYDNVYFGFTSVCASWERKDSQRWEVLQKMPIHRMLLETDAPYFRPAQYQQVEEHKRTGWIALPTMAVNVAFIIARAKSMDVNDVIRATTANTQQMYRIEEIPRSTQIPQGEQPTTSTFRAEILVQQDPLDPAEEDLLELADEISDEEIEIAELETADDDSEEKGRSPRPSQRTVNDNKKKMRIAIESVGINFKKSYAEQDMNETHYGQLYVNWRRGQRAPKDGFGGSRRSDTDKMDPYAVSFVMRSMNIIAIL